MGKRAFHISREKVALLMFSFLMLLGAVFVCSYFFMGRQLNTTATVVDDATGNMQDYALLVFSGIGDGAETDRGPKVGSAKGKDAYAAGLGQNAATALKNHLADAYVRANVKTDLWKNHVFVSEVRDAYELKGAEAATIDLSNFSKYAEPAIIDAGRRKFGVFSIRAYVSKARLKSIEDSLRSKGAQSIICICQNTSMLAAYNGLDAVISLAPLYDDDREYVAGSTLLVETPAKGNVGVLLFSPSNATTYKTVKTL